MDDYIKRSDAIKSLDCLVWSSSADHTRKNTLTAVMRILPTADVRENVRGYWKKRKDKPLQNWYQCSNCGAICGETPKYCSECGAEMRGEQE